MLIKPTLCASATTALLLAALAPAAYAGTASPSALIYTGAVAHYAFNEAVGVTPTRDSSGNHLNGTIDPVDNNVTQGISPGEQGKAYGFADASATGGPAAMISVPDPTGKPSPLNPGTQSLYLSVWLKKSGTSIGDYNVMEKGTATATGGAYKVEVGYQGNRINIPDCEFSYTDASGTPQHPTAIGPNGKAGTGPAQPINQTSWTHVECTFVDGVASIWVNGMPGQTDGTTQTVPASISNAVPLSIGGKPNPNTGVNRHSYVGYLDEACIAVGVSLTDARTDCAP